MRRVALAICVVLGGSLGFAAGGAGTSPPPIDSRYELANRCFALASTVADGEVRADDDGYTVGRGPSNPTRFFFEPTGLGTYLLYDDGGRFAGVGGPTEDVVRREGAGALAEWRVTVPAPDALAARSTVSGRFLTVSRGGELVTTAQGPGPHGGFIPVPVRGCPAFPEAEVNAKGRPFRGTNRDGTVNGFADLHVHVTADDRAGGLVVSGEPFHPFGIAEALGHDADVHGADGGMDVTGNLLRDEVPFGTHDTHGWPTFAGWPTHDTNTHQQVYWRWLERMWRAGERLVVAQVVEDEPICEIEPRRSHSCDETEQVIAQVRKLRALERHVDAQSGGPGKGWFRIVRGPGAARRAIERGKLAVVLGVESSNLFNCSEYQGVPQCDRADVDRGIRLYRRLGIGSVFVAHWTDNAFAGAALEGGAKGAFINIFNRWQTGHYFNTGPCPIAGQGEEVEPLSPVEMAVVAPFFPATLPLATEPPPEYPPGKQCNAKGLTPLGAYLVRRLIENGILIEMDHLSELARARVMKIAAKRRYPLISSHTGTGGAWTEGELRRLFAGGGIAGATPADAPALAKRINELVRYRRGELSSLPLGTDTGGFSTLPGPQGEVAPLRYPFDSHDGSVVFSRQTTGTRSFDLNSDGVAHYGLFADLIAAMERARGGAAAARALFRSAEAYLRMWERAAAAGRR